MAEENDRLRAIRILVAHLERGDFPDRELAGQAGRRGATMELAYGTIRWRRALSWVLDKMVAVHPGVTLEAALLVGLYQTLKQPGMAPHAAVNETVDAAAALTNYRGGGLVNAVLRRSLREREQWLARLEAQPPAVALSHPDVLYDRWVRRFGADAARSLAMWNNLPADVILRVRPGQVSRDELAARLISQGIQAVPHPHPSAQFIILPHGVRVDECPGFAEGWFVVQDPATLAAVDALQPAPGETILDACAAPGGKTILIAERMQGRGVLVAMDRHADRLPPLRANLARLGCPSVRVLEADAMKLAGYDPVLPPGGFDRILVDAPCSNTGVIRRRPDARWRFSLERVGELARVQAAILDGVVPRLKPGGCLVYSTCSLEPEEDEALVAAWTRRHPECTLRQSTQLVPPAGGMDGAFVAVLDKRPA